MNRITDSVVLETRRRVSHLPRAGYYYPHKGQGVAESTPPVRVVAVLGDRSIFTELSSDSPASRAGLGVHCLKPRRYQSERRSYQWLLSSVPSRRHRLLFSRPPGADGLRMDVAAIAQRTGVGQRECVNRFTLAGPKVCRYRVLLESVTDVSIPTACGPGRIRSAARSTLSARPSWYATLVHPPAESRPGALRLYLRISPPGSHAGHVRRCHALRETTIALVRTGAVHHPPYIRSSAFGARADGSALGSCRRFHDLRKSLIRFIRRGANEKAQVECIK